jgi:hypothetical protein
MTEAQGGHPPTTSDLAGCQVALLRDPTYGRWGISRETG